MILDSAVRVAGGTLFRSVIDAARSRLQREPNTELCVFIDGVLQVHFINFNLAFTAIVDDVMQFTSGEPVITRRIHRAILLVNQNGRPRCRHIRRQSIRVRRSFRIRSGRILGIGIGHIRRVAEIVIGRIVVRVATVVCGARI